MWICVGDSRAPLRQLQAVADGDLREVRLRDLPQGRWMTDQYRRILAEEQTDPQIAVSGIGRRKS
jgi:hypothetical protein